jgi:hypothetical protein
MPYDRHNVLVIQASRWPPRDARLRDETQKGPLAFGRPLCLRNLSTRTARVSLDLNLMHGTAWRNQTRATDSQSWHSRVAVRSASG